MKLVLYSKENITDDVWTFEFTHADSLSWKAGQYMHYVIPHPDVDDRGNERWFTISSAPFELNIRVTTRIFEDRASTFKMELSNLNIGDEVEADGPEGDFVVDDVNAEYIFIAGGIGITPIRSILMQLDHDYVDLKAELLYTGRKDHHIFRNDLDGLAQRNEGLNITYFNDPTHIEEADIYKAREKFTDPYYYISGPEAMVEHYKFLLLKLGVPENRLKLDDFPGYNWTTIVTRSSLPQ